MHGIGSSMHAIGLSCIVSDCNGFLSLVGWIEGLVIVIAYLLVYYTTFAFIEEFISFVALFHKLIPLDSSRAMVRYHSHPFTSLRMSLRVEIIPSRVPVECFTLTR